MLELRALYPDRDRLRTGVFELRLRRGDVGARGRATRYRFCAI